jgi:hypothetical protein
MQDQRKVSKTTHLEMWGRPVADYVWKPDLPTNVSPRPFVHPVRTLAGTEVTELMPADHPHHLGVGVAVADVGGANFWGGRTFVSSRGPVLLANHGAQHHTSWILRTTTTLVQALRWRGPDGPDLLHEIRRIAVLPIGDHAWALDFTFELTNVAPEPLSLASPAVNGRPGAGYGGFFWRARRDAQRIHVLGPDRSGERHLHGRCASWVALTGNNRSPWTLIFLAARQEAGIDPWFVRSRDYAAVGSALAWARPLVLAQGAAVRRRIVTVVADGRLRSRQIAGIADGVIDSVEFG